MKLIYSTLLLALVLGNTGCKKYVDIDPPKDQLINSLVFTDDKTATSAVTGIYSGMNEYNYYFANVLGNFMPAMSADDFSYASAFANFDQFKNNAVLPGNQYVGTLWSQPYQFIYQANACLEGIAGSGTLSAGVKAQLTGEAKFVRAFCYFYLVNYFGDVPLITTTDYKVNNVMPRTPQAQVYAAIVADLKEASQLMSDTYQGGERIRPNKSAALALLARTYLYTQQWSDAEQTASTVIANSQYSLPADLSQVFLKNSNEAIWQLQPVNPGRNTWEGSLLVTTATPFYRFYPSMVNAFEAGDKRKTNWTATYTAASGAQYVYPAKYKVRLNTVVTEYSMVMRLAEQYLVRAEARAQQNKLADALDDVKTIRARAGLAALPANLDQASLLLAIEQERKVELFSEWGHRWLDLKRTGRATAVLSPIKPAWKETAVLYPIPTTAMKTNASLVQNKGYE